MRGNRTGEHACDGHTDNDQREAIADSASDGVAASHAHELGVGDSYTAHGVALAPVDGELGCGAENLDELGRQFASCLGLAARSPPRQGTRVGWNGDSAGEQPDCENQTCPRRDGRSRADRHGAGDECDERWANLAEVEVLERVDVGDHA